MNKQKNHKTNAARILDKAKIKYELIPYEVDESDLSAVHVAHVLNQNKEQLFKTLVLKGDKTGYFVCLVPGDKELNLKHMAEVSANKKCDLIPMKDLFDVTGYIRGGCSPIGMKKNFPVYIDKSCLEFEYIFISAGQRGLQIQLNPEDLVKIVKATTVQVSED